MIQQHLNNVPDIIGALLGDCDMPIQKKEPFLESDRILGKNTGQLEIIARKSAPQKGYLNRPRTSIGSLQNRCLDWFYIIC